MALCGLTKEFVGTDFIIRTDEIMIYVNGVFTQTYFDNEVAIMLCVVSITATKYKYIKYDDTCSAFTVVTATDHDIVRPNNDVSTRR